MKNYEIKYNTDLKPVKLTLPFTVLADGSLYMIRQSSTNKGETCSYTHYDCIRDSAGHCVKDKNGNETPNNWVAYNCGSIIFDVNGIQKPNKYKHDVYEIKIYENYTEFTDWKPMHLKKEVEDILSDKY